MTFDPNQFLSQTVTSKGDTQILKVPANEYVAFIDDEKPVTDWFASFAGKKDPSKTFVRINIPCRIENDGLKTQLGRNKVLVFHEFLVDIDENGNLDFGPQKNVKLNQMRDAVGQNVEGQPWNIGMRPGAGPFNVKIIHEPNEKDLENPFVRVGRVSAIK